jgi:Mn2+/Fe2+ NRAMP family transporter
MKKTFLLVMLTVVCAGVVFALAMAVAYAVQSPGSLAWSLCSWQSWLLIAFFYVMLCAIIRGIYELAKYVRDECADED